MSQAIVTLAAKVCESYLGSVQGTVAFSSRTWAILICLSREPNVHQTSQPSPFREQHSESPHPAPLPGLAEGLDQARSQDSCSTPQHPRPATSQRTSDRASPLGVPTFCRNSLTQRLPVSLHEYQTPLYPERTPDTSTKIARRDEHPPQISSPAFPRSPPRLAGKGEFYHGSKGIANLPIDERSVQHCNLKRRRRRYIVESSESEEDSCSYISAADDGRSDFMTPRCKKRNDKSKNAPRSLPNRPGREAIKLDTKETPKTKAPKRNSAQARYGKSRVRDLKDFVERLSKEELHALSDETFSDTDVSASESEDDDCLDIDLDDEDLDLGIRPERFRRSASPPTRFRKSMERGMADLGIAMHGWSETEAEGRAARGHPARTKQPQCQSRSILSDYLSDGGDHIYPDDHVFDLPSRRYRSPTDPIFFKSGGLGGFPTSSSFSGATASSFTANDTSYTSAGTAYRPMPLHQKESCLRSKQHDSFYMRFDPKVHKQHRDPDYVDKEFARLRNIPRLTVEQSQQEIARDLRAKSRGKCKQYA